MKRKHIVDLTLTIDNGMPGVSITTASTVKKEGWNASTLQLHSHSGTHMDAPFHFNVSNQTIDELPLDRLISEAWIVDLRHIAPKEEIKIRHLNAVSNTIKKGDSLLLHTGWNKKIGTTAYRNELPRISKELALWFGKKGINMLGVEPPSVADVNNIKEVTEIHHILMINDIIIIEGLTNLEAFSKSKVTLVALPLKIKNGDGAPARVIAFEE